jgi:hypothetical protein
VERQRPIQKSKVKSQKNPTGIKHSIISAEARGGFDFLLLNFEFS